MFLANNAYIIVLKGEAIKNQWWIVVNIYLLNIGLLCFALYGLVQLLKYVLPSKVKKCLELTVTKGLSRIGVYNKDALSVSVSYRV